jgi:hypothetical protein
MKWSTIYSLSAVDNIGKKWILKDSNHLQKNLKIHTIWFDLIWFDLMLALYVDTSRIPNWSYDTNKTCSVGVILPDMVSWTECEKKKGSWMSLQKNTELFNLCFAVMMDSLHSSVKMDRFNRLLLLLPAQLDREPVSSRPNQSAIPPPRSMSISCNKHY